jgi:hypothetical protein
MHTNRWTQLIWKRSRLLYAVLVGLILTLGALLLPNANALGRTPPDRVVAAKTAGDDAWSALGTGVNGEVKAIAISGNDVYVGGMFDSAGTCTVGCNNIAKWNMTTQSWSALGTGVDGEVCAIAVHDNLVYVGGSFGHAGLISTTRIALWNGGAWSALAAGTDGTVRAIAVSDGDVYVGGDFTQAGGCTGAGVGCYFVARWYSPAWWALSTGTDSYVRALANGGTRVYVGGIFFNASNVLNTAGIAAWHEPGWEALGTGVDGIAGYSVNTIAVNGNDVYIGGMFDSAGGVPVTNTAKWNNASGWSALAPGIGDNGAVNAIAVSGNDVYAGGDFKDNDNGAPNHIAKWNSGSGWSALGQGTDGKVYAIAISGTDLYVGGTFTHAGGKAAHGIARYSLASYKVYLPVVLHTLQQ